MRFARVLSTFVAVALGAAAFAPFPAAAQQRSNDRNNPDVYVVNRYSAPIIRLYASPISDDNWGRDRLDGATIAAGQRGELRPERGRGCTWDVRVIYQNGREEEKRRQELCEVSEVIFDGSHATFPQGNQANPPPRQQGQQDRQPPQPQPQPPPQPPAPARAADTMIVNQGPAVVVSLYAQNANAGDWGQDRLMSGTLRAAGRYHLRLGADQGCIFNLRFVFAGGAVETRQAQNLCDLPELVVSGRAQPGQVIASATGFYVSRLGHVLTTFHAVRNCSAVAIARPGGQRVAMERVAEDAEFDLALYRVPDLVSPVAPFRLASSGLRVGENLVVVGYPSRRVLGAVTVANSAVTATSGPGGDQARFQFQAGPGDEAWGAPVYDANGLVVGISNDPQFTGRPGTGIQRDAIARFLRRNHVEMTEVAAGETRRLPSMQDYAFPVVLPLDCIQ
jgi:S1-C subfamily serine protease